MSIMIGHASGDENKCAKGGELGDQTTKEVCVRNWYDKGWNKVLRCKDSECAEKIAVAMEQACMNNNIGYDQGNRLSLSKFIRDGVAIDKVGKCECDCSSLVAVCVNLAGIEVSYGIYTGNEAEALKKTGMFSVLTAKKYLTADSCLKRGDILLKEFSHTAVVLTDGVPKKEEAVKKVEVANNFDKKVAGTYEVITSLNMRLGAGKTKEKVAVAKAGETVKCYGYYNVVDGVKWLYVVYNGVACYCSSLFLTKKR